MLGVEIAKWSSAGSIFAIAVLLGIDNQPTLLEEFEGCMCVVVSSTLQAPSLFCFSHLGLTLLV